MHKVTVFTRVMTASFVLERECCGEILDARTNGKCARIPATFDTRADGDAAV